MCSKSGLPVASILQGKPMFDKPPRKIGAILKIILLKQIRIETAPLA